MMSSSSFAMLLVMLALGVALMEAAGRPLESWANNTLQNTQDEEEGVEEEGVMIPSFLHNYMSPLDAEKTKQYVTFLEDHTIGQYIVEFCRDANLMCNSNITIDDFNMERSRDDLDEDLENHQLFQARFQNTSESDFSGEALQFGEDDFLKGKDIVLPESLYDLPNPSPSFLPHFLIEKMPFSSDKIQELVKTFHILYNSNLAIMMSRTISRCELVNEESSKEVDVGKEKDTKEKEIEVSKDKEIKEKEIKEKEIDVSKEKEVEEKEIEHKMKEKDIKEKEVEVSKEKEIKEKEIGLGKENEVEGKEIEDKKKESKQFGIELSNEKEVKEKEIKLKENQIKEKEINMNKKKETKTKGMKGENFEYIEDKEFVEKETVQRREKSSKEEIGKKIIEKSKSKEVKRKEKEVKNRDIEQRKEKETKGKESKRKDMEQCNEMEVKEKNVKQKVYKSKKEKSRRERKVKVKQNKHKKEKQMTEKDTHVSKEKSSEEKKVKETKIKYRKEKAMKKKDIHVSAKKSSEDKKSKETKIEHNKENKMKEKNIYVKKEKSSKEIRKCVTSLEGMTSFVKKSLPKEKHIKVLERSSSTKLVDQGYKKIKWKVLAMKEYEKAVVCKNNIFLFAVFECHNISKTKDMRIYYIDLEGMDGVHRKEILACNDQKKSTHNTKFASNMKESCQWVINSIVWAPAI